MLPPRVQVGAETSDQRLRISDQHSADECKLMISQIAG